MLSESYDMERDWHTMRNILLTVLTSRALVLEIEARFRICQGPNVQRHSVARDFTTTSRVLAYHVKWDEEFKLYRNGIETLQLRQAEFRRLIQSSFRLFSWILCTNFYLLSQLC